MPNKVDTTDAAIAEIAARQHGVIAAKQIAAVGLGRAAISERTRAGRMHRVHQGVYAVGHRGLSLHARFMAAVLACGDGAVLSHISAAILWQLLKPLSGPSTSPRPRPQAAPAVPASTSIAPRPSNPPQSLPRRPPTRSKKEGDGEGS